MVAHTLKTYDDSLNIVEVVATRGKLTRAEPVAALYQQGKVHHVGIFDTMEDQMCIWEPGLTDSPDRMDALVWAFSELMVNRRRSLNLPAIGVDSNDLRIPSAWKRSGTGID